MPAWKMVKKRDFWKNRTRPVDVELTPEEVEYESGYFGVKLPRKYQARYKALHAQKVLERRERLENENWEAREFPK